MTAISSRSKTRSIQETTEFKLWNDELALNTSSDEIDCLDAESITLSVRGNTGVSSGVVSLEQSPVSGDTGTWKSLGTLTINAANTWFTLTIPLGANPGSPFGYVRARISTIIGGGNCDAYLAVRK